MQQGLQVCGYESVNIRKDKKIISHLNENSYQIETSKFKCYHIYDYVQEITYATGICNFLDIIINMIQVLAILWTILINFHKVRINYASITKRINYFLYCSNRKVLDNLGNKKKEKRNNTCDSVKKIKRIIFYINFSKLTKLKLQT